MEDQIITNNAILFKNEVTTDRLRAVLRQHQSTSYQYDDALAEYTSLQSQLSELKQIADNPRKPSNSQVHSVIQSPPVEEIQRTSTMSQADFPSPKQEVKQRLVEIERQKLLIHKQIIGLRINEALEMKGRWVYCQTKQNVNLHQTVAEKTSGWGEEQGLGDVEKRLGVLMDVIGVLARKVKEV